MQLVRPLIIIISFLFGTTIFSQIRNVESDTLVSIESERGERVVNKCTPWHHLQCVYITGTEVYADGSEGESTRHWWRMSYIGRACTAKHGTRFGKIFEGIFAVPHYIGVAIGNGIGYMVYIIRGSPQKIEARKARRAAKRAANTLLSIINDQ